MKSIKFVFFKGIVILFLTLATKNSFAQAAAENYGKTDALNNIQFAGVIENYLIFDLRLSELPAKGCTVTITDESGSLFFEESASGNSFIRRYKVPKDGISRISFRVAGKGFLVNQSFTIKKEEKLVVSAD